MVSGNSQNVTLGNTGLKKVKINVSGFPFRFLSRKQAVAFPATKFFTGIDENPVSPLAPFFKPPQK